MTDFFDRKEKDVALLNMGEKGGSDQINKEHVFSFVHT